MILAVWIDIYQHYPNYGITMHTGFLAQCGLNGNFHGDANLNLSRMNSEPI